MPRSIRPALATRMAICFAVAALVGSIAALGMSTGWLSGLGARTSDALVFPRGEVSDDVAVVAIDARSVADARQAWPWSRDAQAELVEAITAAGARVVVLDIVLAPAGDGDDRLAAALDAVPSVIGAAVETTTASQRQWTGRGVLIASNLIVPEPVFASTARVAHTAMLPDSSDGVTRVLPLVVEADRRFIPALSLAAMAASDGADAEVIVRSDSVQIGTRSVPTDGHHRLRISFTAGLAGAQDVAVVSAADILGGSARSELDGKVVFVGVTDPTSGDRLLTPIAKRSGMAGVLVHANAFNTIATGTYLSEVSTATSVVWVVALALVVALATVLLRPWTGALAAVVSFGSFMLWAIHRADGGVIHDVTYPALGVLAALTISAGLREVLVDRQRRRITRLFGQYVPPGVAREIVGDQRASDLLNGRSMEVTVVFCDIRGFTPLTAPLEPGQIRALLDSYYSVLSEVVLSHGGSVLRYTGDEILSVFGAPRASADHPADAVRCALAMQGARAQLAEVLVAQGLPPLDYGIGVQSGDVVSAVMGSEVRRQYAVIGTPLTLGSRLCAQAMAGETIVSSETWAGLVDVVPPAEQFTASLKGREDDVVLYRIGPLTIEAS